MNKCTKDTWVMLFLVLILAFGSQLVCAQTGGAADSQSKQDKSFLDIYGFVMMDTGYDFKQVNPDWYDVVRPTKLPSHDKEFGADGNYYFSVRQTRFGVKSETPTSLGTLKTQ